jgi:hypothetical protein
MGPDLQHNLILHCGPWVHAQLREDGARPRLQERQKVVDMHR